MQSSIQIPSKSTSNKREQPSKGALKESNAFGAQTERNQRKNSLQRSTESMNIYLNIYIYIYTYMYTYIYTYIYTDISGTRWTANANGSALTNQSIINRKSTKINQQWITNESRFNQKPTTNQSTIAQKWMKNQPTSNHKAMKNKILM